MITPAALALEAEGVFVWLQTCFPFAFEEEFSEDHKKFWRLFWSILMRIREQTKYQFLGLPTPEEHQIDENEWVILLVLGRGLGKSATIEASAVMRGAILDGGYCLYISEAQDQADEHIGNCKILIDHEDTRLTEFYPSMAIDEGAVVDGMKVKDASDMFITNCGWICRSKGLNSKLRGLRKGGRRPDDINIDDIDSVNDSISVSIKKIKQLTSSVIPTQARRFATIKFGQNIIAEGSVMNQILTGKSDALASRTVIGVSNTFENFEENTDYVTEFDEVSGRIKHVILPTARPTWDGVDIAQAQKFLNDSGMETFLAEYQNSFQHLKSEKVYHEYNEERHIITWDDFERVFGVRYIPAHWRAAVGVDIGYSENSVAAWAFLATAAQNSPLPSRYFLYRGLTFTEQGMDNQAIKVWKTLFPQIALGKRHYEANQKFEKYPELRRVLEKDPNCGNLLRNYDYNPISDQYETKQETEESQDQVAKYYLKLAQKTFTSQIVSWRMSHEKTGEQITLAQKYGLPVQKTKHFGKEAGITETNNLLRGDYTRPHPFYPDEITLDRNGAPTGFYRLGSPYMYLVVAPKQKDAPLDDDGLKVFREHLQGQRWTFEKMTETGISRRIPMKYLSDCLVAGTLVKTINGDVPIENIKVGDWILTRKGYRKCVRSFLSEKNAQVYRLTAEDGTQIEGTGNHPVFVEGKGFVDLSLIGDSDRIVKCELNEPNSKEQLLYLTAFPSIDTRTLTTFIFAGIIGVIYQDARLLCTWLFGSMLLAKFPKDMRFTTATTTPLITTCPILDVSHHSNTESSIQARLKRRHTRSAFYRLPRKRLKYGIEAKRVGNGTFSTVNESRLLFKLWTAFASTAVKSINPKHRIEQNTVLPDVSRGNTTAQVINPNKENASSAEIPLSAMKAVGVNTAPVNVANVVRMSERKDVYNLTVDEVPEFFAGDILVHNCGDSLRMICAEYKTAFATPLTAHEARELTVAPQYREDVIAQDIGFVPDEEIDARRIARDIKLNFENPLKSGKSKENVIETWDDLYNSE